MSTPITLAVGDIDLTYNTGHMGMDHGMLFQERDRRRRGHASINYEYYEKHLKVVSQRELCFYRTLGSMVSRLELLGYTLESVEADYQVQIALDSERFANTEDGGRR